MRKLIVSNAMSLDGYYEGSGKNVMSLFDYRWDYPTDESFDAYNGELLHAADTLLLGRVSYYESSRLVQLQDRFWIMSWPSGAARYSPRFMKLFSLSPRRSPDFALALEFGAFSDDASGYLSFARVAIFSARPVGWMRRFRDRTLARAFSGVPSVPLEDQAYWADYQHALVSRLTKEELRAMYRLGID
jgi:hypothetical protein